MKTRKIGQYSISPKGLSNSIRSGILWGIDKDNPSIIFPLIYFRKPKWLSQESYNQIVDKIKLELEVGFEVKGDER